MDIPHTIFRAYDIRGIVGKELSDELAYAIGKAFATMCKRAGYTRIAVGHDARHTGEAYALQVCAAISDTGLTAIHTGLISTPIAYYAAYAGHADASCMITASHNPPEFNGYKMVMGTAKLTSEQIQQVREMIEAQDYDAGEGAIIKDDMTIRYIEHILSIENHTRPLRIVVDAGNGTGGIVLPGLLRSLGHEVIELYCDPDGNFPNHHPDPTELESLADIRARVIQEGADLGIALDGDADRLAIIDQQGEAYWGDRVVAAFATDVLAQRKGKVVYDVKCSQALRDAIIAAGGEALESRTGHTFISLRIAQENALLGGEMSGHIYFNDRYYGYDDAIYAGVRMAGLVSASDTPASEHFPESSYTTSPEIKVHVNDTNKFRIMHALEQSVTSMYENVLLIDGVKAYTDDGWFLIRASNTQPVLVVRAEASSEGALASLLNHVREILAPLLEEQGHAWP